MFNEDRGANRGEWSELYTFCYILSAGNYMPLILN